MTRNSAITLPQHADDIGTLSKGKFADVLVVNGNPDEDVTLLQDSGNIGSIMKAGAFVAAWRPEEAVRTRHPFERTHTYAPAPYRKADQATKDDNYTTLISRDGEAFVHPPG
jgi:hypothetical protein